MVRNLLAAAVVAAALATPVGAAELTIVSWGGATQDAHRAAYFAPFAASTGIRVLEDSWSSEIARLEAAARARPARWDVVQVNAATVRSACEDGLLEPIDEHFRALEGDLVPGALQRCGVGSSVGATVLAWRTDRFASETPKTLADFWDVRRFPGPRGLRKSPRVTLEWALLADGVARDQLYATLATEAGVERALRKLDEIRPHVAVWWFPFAQSIDILLDGQVVMTPAPNGRVVNAVRSKSAPLGIVWDHQAQNMDYWAIVRGSANRPVALDFIAFASRPEPMRRFVEAIFFGPTLRVVAESLPAEVRGWLPTAPENAGTAFFVDPDFWGTHGARLEERFQAWLAG